MTSSGAWNFTVNNGDAVFGAFDRIRVRAPSVRQEHMVTARRELNLLFTEWSNRQVNLWTVEFDTIPMVNGTKTYTLNPNTILVLDAYISTNAGSQFGQNNIYITQLSRTQYASLANPNTPGQPTQYWFDRLITPTLTMWPVPDANGPYTLGYYRAVQIQDANLPNGETPNLPNRWLDAMIAGLAYRLSMSYAPELETQRKADYNEAWAIAAAQDTEVVNLSLAPALNRYYPK